MDAERTYIGVDNGTTGTIGIIPVLNGYRMDEVIQFFKTPIIKQQSYTKKKQNITRLDWRGLGALLKPFHDKNPYVILEVPFNGTMLKTIKSSHRFCEATEILLEMLKYPYRFINSREWQKEILQRPGKQPLAAEWKILSTQLGEQEFPQFRNAKPKFPDFDGIWIAEWARRNKL